MPINAGGTIVCVNHPAVPMQIIDGLQALVAVNKTRAGVLFRPDSGLPVVAYVCNLCGYIETYAAIKTPYWDEIDLSPQGVTPVAAKAFEDAALQALVAQLPGPPAQIQREVGLPGQPSTSPRVDAILSHGDRLLVVDVKAAPPGTQLLSAAAQVREFANLAAQSYRHNPTLVIPLLIVPPVGLTQADYYGVLVLEFDATQGQFTNRNALINRIAQPPSNFRL